MRRQFFIFVPRGDGGRRRPPAPTKAHSDLPNCTRGAKSSLGISAALADAYRPLNHYAQNVRSGRFGKSAYRSIVVLTIFHDFASFFMIFDGFSLVFKGFGG